MENFINKFLNKIKFTINDQSMKDFATRFITIKIFDAGWCC